MNSLRIGVLAEDKTDCETVAVLVRRMVGERTAIRRRYGGGCSQLMRKAVVWMNELADDGCLAVIFVHDLDRDPQSRMLKDEGRLRQSIAALALPRGVQRHICIPVEELEAWFWSDPAVLERIAPGLGRGRAQAHPHQIARPKESLWHLSAQAHRNARYTTQLNPSLAETLDLALCAKRCRAFQELHAFVSTL